MRNAQNALEMNHTGKLIVTTIDYLPERWNTKPPLMIWVLAISQRLLGYNEIAVRLPSAIAAALTCFLLLHFSKRRLGRWLPGLVAVLILVTTRGYVGMHGVRTGDYDSLLTLFTTASLISLVNYLEDGARNRWLYLSAAALTAAVLTKGVAGLFICPAMLAYVLLRGKGRLLFRERAFYACALAFVVIIGGYYALREAQQPGYLALVAENELGGRFGGAVESHGGDFWTYYNELIYTAFVPWTLLIIPAILSGFFVRDMRYRRMALLCGLTALTILLILSCASTKLGWYMLPMYPFLALFCALPLCQLLQLLQRWKAPARIWTLNFLPFLVLLFIAWTPYAAILDETISGKYARLGTAVNDAGIYLKEAIAGNRTLTANAICGDTYPLYWYRAVVREQGGALPDIKEDSLKAGMRVLTWEDNIKEHIRKHYKAREEDNYRSVTVFLIEGKMKDDIQR
jgi:4-amino-4-deoxy-L-arabinose transferase-like glycosyltransferase